MDEARSHAAWDHTAQVLCLLANINRGDNDEMPLHDFHPFLEPPELSPEEFAANWEAFKNQFSF